MFIYFRMSSNLANHLVEILRPYSIEDSRGVSPKLQSYSCLRFLAEGGYQKGMGTDVNSPMSQSTVSKYIHKVIQAINRLASLYIRCPQTLGERAAIQQG